MLLSNKSDERWDVTEFSYDGFISYSHAADGLLAPRLQAGLQRFAKPWWKRRALRLFRDESSLSANPHLWSSITEALDSSGWFVLLLSPEAAQSEWVGQEIEYWIANRDPSRILPVVTDGEFGWVDGDVVGDAVPDTLRGVFAEEPRWVDLRWAKDEDQLDLQDPRFADAVADVGSAIRGVPKDELASEEVKQHRRTVRTAWVAGFGLAALAVLAGVLAVQSANNAAEAERQAEVAATNAAAEEAARVEADESAALAEASATAEADARLSAETNGALAVQNERLAKARELAASAINVLDEDPELGVLLSLEALRHSPDGDDPPVELVDALWDAGSRHRLVNVFEPTIGEFSAHDLSLDDSRLAVVVLSSRSVHMYDAESGGLLWERFEETSDNLFDVKISPDGRWTAVGIADSEAFTALVGGEPDDHPARVLVLDSETGQIEVTLEFPDCPEIEVIEWAPDNDHLVVSQGPPGPGPRCTRTGSAGGQWVELFETEKWTSHRLIDTPMREDFFDGPVPHFDDAGRLYVFGWSSPPRVYSPDDYQLMAEVEDAIGSGAVSPDGRLFARYGFTTTSRYELLDSATGAVVDRLAGGDSRPQQPQGMAFARDGSQVLAATAGESSYVWDVESGERLHTLPGGDAGRVTTNGDTTVIYSGHADGMVRVWDIGRARFGVEVAGDLRTATWVNGTPFSVGPIHGIAQLLDIERGISYVQLFDAATGQLSAERREGHGQLALEDGRFVYRRLTSEAVVWDPSDGSETPLFGCATEDSETCADSGQELPNYVGPFLSLSGGEIAAPIRGEDGTMLIETYDAVTGSRLGTEQLVSGSVPAIDFVGFNDSWWMIETPTGVAVVARETAEVLYKSPIVPGLKRFRPDGSLTCCHDRRVPGEITDGQHCSSWRGLPVSFLHRDSPDIRGLAFSPDWRVHHVGARRRTEAS